MIISALFSFLGGSVFRMIWGEVASWMNKKLDHEHEMERLTLQKDLDTAAHGRTMEALRVQSDLQLKVVHAEMEAGVNIEEAKAFTAAMADAFKPTGITWVDAWNGIIRPAAASIGLLMWVGKLVAQGGAMEEWDMDLLGAILGFFFADRSLGRRGK